MLVFALEPYHYLQEAICQQRDVSAGRIESRRFPDGECYHRVLDTVAGRDVALIGGTIDDEQTLVVYDVASALVSERAASLTLLVPYFGHSTMDRAVWPGEAVTAKTRARLLSNVPQAANGNRIVLVDLHSEGLPYYFEGALQPVHIYAKPIVLEAVRELGGERFVLASADAGRAKWVQSLARDLHVPAAVAIKQRSETGEVTVEAASTVVAGQDVVLFDDMVRSGDTLMRAAEAYRTAGATSIAAVVTHGVLPDGALERLQSSGLLIRLICTDSHPRAQAFAQHPDFAGFFQVRSLAPLLADFLQPAASSGSGP